MAPPLARLDLGLSQYLLTLGFDPAAPVYTHVHNYSRETIAEALFGACGSPVKVIPFAWLDDEGAVVAFPMEVHLVHRVSIGCLTDAGDREVARSPSWYLSGFLATGPLNPCGADIRMHGFINWTLEEAADPREDCAYLQVVRVAATRDIAISLDGRLQKATTSPRRVP